MATIQEAYSGVLAGEKWRRPEWEECAYIFHDKDGIQFQYRGEAPRKYIPTSDAILLNDWVRIGSTPPPHPYKTWMDSFLDQNCPSAKLAQAELAKVREVVDAAEEFLAFQWASNHRKLQTALKEWRAICPR